MPSSVPQAAGERARNARCAGGSSSSRLVAAWGVLVSYSLSCGVARAEPSARERRPWLKTASPQGPARASEHQVSTRASVSASESESDVADRAARDGFFARLSLGSGWFTARSGSSDDRRAFSGAPLSIEALFGGSPQPGIGFGAGYTRDDIFALSSEDEVVDGDEPELDSTRFHLEAIRVFATFRLDPTSPYLAFATLGLATLDVRSQNGGIRLPVLAMIAGLDSDDPKGWSLTVGGGYDFSLSDDWTAGVAARLLAAWLSGEDAARPENVRVIMPSLLFTLGYH